MRWMTGRVGVFNWIIAGIIGKQQQQQSKHNGTSLHRERERAPKRKKMGKEEI
jgi:hypothetical protein